MRSRRRIALATLIMVLLGTALSSAGAAQDDQVAAPAALFNLTLAQSELDTILIEADRIRNELADVLDGIDGLTIERDFIKLNDKGRNDIMQQARSRARNMAVNAYVGIGPPLSGVVLLDAESANDLSFHNGLLRQQAERLHEAAETYAVLAGEADANVLEIVDTINGEIRQAEGLNRALARTVDKIPHAEWIVSIAEIHHEADLAFLESQRPEPSEEHWRKLRFCESTETYDIDTGNTFYGAYQFTLQTWETVGGEPESNPAHAHPAEQDARARWLYATRGSQPWPICGRFLP